MLTLSKKIQRLSTAAVLAALAAPASAASYYPAQGPVRPNYAAEPAPVGSSYVVDPAIPLWAGPYIGAHIGGTMADFSNSAPTAGPSGSAGSINGGGQIGYLWQSNRLVYGVEADASWLDLSTNTGTRFHEGYDITARGRLGYAMGSWLPYATGGVAFTNTRFEDATGASTENIEPGFTVGGGVEKYIAPRISARLEYLYTDVPKETETPGATTMAGGSSNNSVRLGVNYHF